MSERDKLIKEYVQNGGEFYKVKSVHKVRDYLEGGGCTMTISKYTGFTLYMHSRTLKVYLDSDMTLEISEQENAYLELCLEELTQRTKHALDYYEHLSVNFKNKKY